MQKPENWSELTPAEKREIRFAAWMDTSGIEFDSAEAEKAYNTRIKRLADTLLMKKADRVPVSLPVDTFPALYAGVDLHTVMYDYDELYRAWKKFLMEFDMDSVVSPGMVYPGKVFDIVDYKLYAWPGHGLPMNATGFQFVEGEYMMSDEYDAFFTDPSDFAMRVYVPRTVGALAGFKKLPPLTQLLGKPQFLLPVTAQPDVMAAFQALVDAGKERAQYQKIIMKFGREAQAAGFPGMRGAVSFAPFDTLSDAMRGTKGIIMDMYRQPENVLKAVDMIADFNIRNTVESVDDFGGIMVMFPLHKGDDTFMSNAQFEKFYWPSLRKFIMGLMNEGIMVMLFAEGKYNNRLEQVKDIPPGWILWHFDQTDMFRAKEVLGDQCLTGNVPTSLMCTGTPEAVKESCRKLIEVCGKGGGYILNAGAGSAQVKEENLRAMMDAAKEYGVY